MPVLEQENVFVITAVLHIYLHGKNLAFSTVFYLGFYMPKVVGSILSFVVNQKKFINYNGQVCIFYL
jgi:hypothetical protein